MPKVNITVICLLTFFSSFSTSYGQKKKLKEIISFGAEVSDLQKKLQIPGLSFAIVKDQKLLYATGLGWADIEKKIPATKHTLYSIASLTKTFTSTLLMQLVEKGKLNLDDPISKYDSNFKSDSLKVYHFLTHTSEGKPGTQFKYNGDKFALLQRVIEKVTGKPFEAVINEDILSKIEMKESVAGHDVMESNSTFTSLRKQFANPYTLYGTDELILSPYPPKKITASAGLLSSVDDLAKYDIALDKHQLISEATQAKAWTAFSLANATISPYGYGWFIQTFKGKKIVWHYGQWPTYTGLYIKVPEQNLSLIMLANSDGLARPFGLGNGNVSNSAFALAFIRNFITSPSLKLDFKWNLDTTAFKDQLRKLQSRYGDDSFSGEVNAYTMITRYLLNRQLRVKKEVKIDTKLYHNYVGTYELLPVPLKISIEENKLMVVGPLLTSKVELYPETENKFFLKILNAQIEFLRNEDGIVDECILYLDGNKYQCRKLSG